MKLRGKKATEILGQTVLWIILIASLLISPFRSSL